MAKQVIMQEIDVFGLFEALKRDGYTKLSDHVINDDPGTAGDSSRDPEK